MKKRRIWRGREESWEGEGGEMGGVRIEVWADTDRVGSKIKV